MNQVQTFRISFGNDHGEQSVILLEEKKKIIEIGKLKTVQIDHPKISIRKYNEIQLGEYLKCIKKNINKDVLLKMLELKINVNVDLIQVESKEIQDKIANDLVLLGAMMEESLTEQFINKTNANGKQSQKYISKFGNLDKAVSQYQRHQKIVDKFMKSNSCNRDNAISFLESNNYDESLLF